MAIEVSTDRARCYKCGTEYSKHRGNFPVSYSAFHKGVGFTPICKTCIDNLYNSYLSQCNDSKAAMRQVCRKLDLYWNENLFNSMMKKVAAKSIVIQYIARINSVTYAGKSYDDTLLEDGTMWNFSKAEVQEEKEELNIPEPVEVSQEVIDYWGEGYPADMYRQLEQRRHYWVSGLGDDVNLDVGTEAIIRQICSLELDINRDRAAGKSVDKSVGALNNLLGSANLKPVQKKQEDLESQFSSTPLGVWLYRYENERPLPEIDDELKDVNKIKKYVFTWMGHLCKMLGIKNGYSEMYEEEIRKLRVEKPEYDGDDDEAFFAEVMNEQI